MRVILFGATGMVGQGVLRECLLASDIERVLAVGRRGTGQEQDKLRELVQADMADYSAVESQLDGYDACFYCLGVSAAGMSEADYTRVTYDFTLAAAEVLVRLNPAMTFVYVSGAGTRSSEEGGAMWARVKGRTENALLAMPFGAAVMFRPGIIQPRHGAVSRTRLYRVFYAVMRPLFPILRLVAPGSVTTTEAVGRAMLRVAREGAPKPLLDNRDINALAAEGD